MAGSINPLAYPVVLRLPEWLPPHTPADGCLPLARLVVAMLEPAQVVALGVGRGETYAALCQAVQALHRATRCVGVELNGAAGAEGLEAPVEFRAHHLARYGAFSRLIPAEVQDAAAYFADGSIDLLHLSADLEAAQVADAWRCWQPKLSSRAAVLVSHIQPANRGPSLTHFWAEARQTYPHFELLQGQGLGLLLVGAETPDCLAQLTRLPAAEEAALAELLYRLGQAASAYPLDAAEPRLAQAAPALRSQDTEIAALNQTLREQTEHLDQVQGRLDLVTAREREIRALYLDLHQQLLNRDQNAGQMAERDRIIGARDATIARQQEELAQAQAQAAAERAQLSAARDQALAERDRLSPAHDEALTELRADLALAQAEIRTIHGGRIWRLSLVYWQIYNRCLALVRRSSGRAK